MCTLCPKANVDSEVIDHYLRLQYGKLDRSSRKTVAVIPITTCTRSLLTTELPTRLFTEYMEHWKRWVGETRPPARLIVPVQQTHSGRKHYVLVDIDLRRQAATYYDTVASSLVTEGYAQDVKRKVRELISSCLLYTSPRRRDLST